MRSRVLLVWLIAIVLACMAVGATCQTPFDTILRDFRQTRSGVCVTYAHTLALAQADPAAFVQLIQPRPKGWAVDLAGRKQYVPQSELDKSLKNGWSGGESDNLITIFAMAVSMRQGGYHPLTGMLDYGPAEYSLFIGSGKWVLFDPSQGPGKSLPDGLDKLAIEAKADGTPGSPATMGFGLLDEKTIPNDYAEVCKLGFWGGHDYAVVRYDAVQKAVVLRNPACPKTPVSVPVELLKRIPCGIDFMVPADKK